MTLPWKIARRYLFAKRSTNAINIITGIAVLGIAVGAAALILVLSVFNGFEDLITEMYSNFNPQLKVTPVKGKTFEADSSLILKLQRVEGVDYISQTLEEVAFFEYKEQQDFGTLKGVDRHFVHVSGIDTTIREGSYRLVDSDRNLAVSGVGIRNRLGLSLEDPFTPISVYMAKRKEVGPFQQPFRKRFIYPAGTFVIQQEFDNQYVLAPIQLARELLGYTGPQVSALEISLVPGAREAASAAGVSEIMGDGFEVKDRYQQEETFLKLMKVEKWLSFAIVALMIMLVAFNLVGALWMVVLEKQADIGILKSMGATDGMVRRIFLLEGLLLSWLGILIGIGVALLLFAAQRNFGLIGIPGQYVVQSYPISLRLIDFFVVIAAVSGIGLLASLPPARRAGRVSAIVREE